jgi:hypothetical protein
MSVLNSRSSSFILRAVDSNLGTFVESSTCSISLTWWKQLVGLGLFVFEPDLFSLWSVPYTRVQLYTAVIRFARYPAKVYQAVVAAAAAEPPGVAKLPLRGCRCLCDAVTPLSTTVFVKSFFRRRCKPGTHPNLVSPCSFCNFLFLEIFDSVVRGWAWVGTNFPVMVCS